MKKWGENIFGIFGYFIIGSAAGLGLIKGIEYSLPIVKREFAKKYPIVYREAELEKSEKFSKAYKPDCNQTYLYLELEYLGINPNDANKVDLEICSTYSESAEESSYSKKTLKIGKPYKIGEYKESFQDITMTPLEIIVDEDDIFGSEKLKIRLSAPKINE